MEKKYSGTVIQKSWFVYFRKYISRILGYEVRQNIKRILAVIIMFSGIGLISVLTGSISSIFTTKKIMEGRGLENLNLKNHIVICGWNSNIEKVLSNIAKLSSEGEEVKIAMINDMGEDQMNSIIARFNSDTLKIYFVRGDYALESILN